VLLVVLPVFFPAHVLPDLLVALQEVRADLATTSARIGDAFHEDGCVIMIMIVATGQMNIILDVELLLNDLQCDLLNRLEDLGVTILLGEAQRMVTDAPMEDVSQ